MANGGSPVPQFLRLLWRRFFHTAAGERKHLQSLLKCTILMHTRCPNCQYDAAPEFLLCAPPRATAPLDIGEVSTTLVCHTAPLADNWSKIGVDHMLDHNWKIA